MSTDNFFSTLFRIGSGRSENRGTIEGDINSLIASLRRAADKNAGDVASKFRVMENAILAGDIKPKYAKELVHRMCGDSKVFGLLKMEMIRDSEGFKRLMAIVNEIGKES